MDKVHVYMCLHIASIKSTAGFAAHLRGMRPAPSSQKDTLMLRENSNFKTIN